MVVALVALVLALGGTSYAALKLPKNSVGTKQLKRNAVRTADIRANAVTGAKVKNGSLSGSDINLASLGAVPSAAAATRAASAAVADQAALASGLARVIYRTAPKLIAAAPSVGNSTEDVATARCDAGHLVVGGGAKLEEGAAMSLVDSYPDSAAAWTAHAANDDPLAAHTVTVFAVCIPAAAAG